MGESTAEYPAGVDEYIVYIICIYSAAVGHSWQSAQLTFFPIKFPLNYLNELTKLFFSTQKFKFKFTLTIYMLLYIGQLNWHTALYIGVYTALFMHVDWSACFSGCENMNTRDRAKAAAESVAWIENNIK